MPVTNTLKTQVDTPVYEWLRFAPTATTATSCLVASDINARYMYYIVGQAMWRYDTFSDSWQECQAPNIAPVTAVAAKYAAYSGHRTHVISATSTTVTIGGLGKNSNLAQGLKIRIIAGKGAGQERTISAVSDGVIHDFGVCTTAGTTSIADSTKKWRINQWDGYNCRLTFSNGAGQVRTILYNDGTTLTFSDPNFQAQDPWNNTVFNSISPYTTPITTAGSQTHFVIESTDLTVDSAWTVTPDASSIIQIMSGGIWLLSSTAATPWCSWQYYNILMDTWHIKTPIGPSHLTAALGTDFSIDRTGEAGGVFVTGKTASSGTARTLVDSGETFDRDRYANYQIRITGGTGIGQRRRIVGHTADTFYVEHKWDVTPDATSQYEIYGNVDSIRCVGNNSSVMWNYSVEKDLWANGNIVDTGVVRNISATPSGGTGYGPPHEGFAVTSITYAAAGILTVAISAAGINYVIGDLVSISGGTGGLAYVTDVTQGGNVTGIQLAASGSGYTAATQNTTLGTGTGLTITVTVGKVGNVVTATNHDFRHNDNVTIAGCATDTTFNGTFAIIGTSTLTAFSIANPSGTASPTAANSFSTTVIVDATQNWDTNEHVGKLVYVQTAGQTPTTLGSRRITANTATTITVGTALTAMTHGQSRYLIQEIKGLGAMSTSKVDGRESYGWATSGTASTLVDSSKTWIPNQWNNCRVRVISGTGVGNDVVILTNTATQLNVAAWNVATPDATSKYEILDSYGIITTGSATATMTDANKNYATNYLAGKRIRIVAGTGLGNEQSIVSNTATTITVGTALTTDTSSVYEIYEVPVRSTGTDITWLYGLSDTAKKGRWLISPRGGGSNVIDIYDIPTNTWEVTTEIAPFTQTLTTGSMYCYDGADSYFFHKDATGRIYELDVSKFAVNACGTIPYNQNTAILGARMELIKTTDNLKYLYIMRHTGQEMWRTLKFW